MDPPISINILPTPNGILPISSSPASGANYFQCFQIPSSNGMNLGTGGPYLEIIDQPINKFRFRYKTEMKGPHGSLTAQHSKARYPSVHLKNFIGEAVIRCSICQIKANDLVGPIPHPNQLVFRNKKNPIKNEPHESIVSQELGYKATFRGLTIMITKKEDINRELFAKLKTRAEFEAGHEITAIESNELQLKVEEYSTDMKMDQVLLCFEAYHRVNGMWTLLCLPRFSDPILDSRNELRICRKSIDSGSAAGNDEVYLFVENVDKKDIEIRFYETNGDHVVWEAFGRFNEGDVHHQTAIAFKTPAYHRTDIGKCVNVYIQLRRPSNGSCSNSVPFQYKPAPIYDRKWKRPRDDPNYDNDATNGVLPIFENGNVQNTNNYVRYSSIRPDDAGANQIVQDLYNASQNRLALNNEDFSAILETLDETSDLDMLVKDSIRVEIAAEHNLSTTEQLAAKILQKTESLLKIDDKNAIPNRKFFKFLLEKTFIDGRDIIDISLVCKDHKLMDQVWAILRKFQLHECLERGSFNEKTCEHSLGTLDKSGVWPERMEYSAIADAVDVNENAAGRENHGEYVGDMKSDLFTGKDVDAKVLNDSGWDPFHSTCGKMDTDSKTVKIFDAVDEKKQNVSDDIGAKGGNNALQIPTEVAGAKLVSHSAQNKRKNTKEMNKSDYAPLYLEKVTKSIEILNLDQQPSLVDNDQNEEKGEDN